jgi:hypothetical protein
MLKACRGPSADLDTPEGLLDAAYDVALMVQTYADENEVSWSEAHLMIPGRAVVGGGGEA